MKKLMGLISANYSNNAFAPLTDDRPPASLPFGGRYRLVDFPLSNMVNSGLQTVGLITPYMYRSLMDHVGVGKEWTLSRKVGGMFILPGSIYGFKSIHDKFLLRDIIGNMPFLERGESDLVVVSSCSKIYNIDFREVAARHEESGADVTLICMRDFFPSGDSERYVGVTDSGRVTSISNSPLNGSCMLDAFIIDRQLLMKFAKWYEALNYMDVIDIFIENLDNITVRAFEFDGYVGSVNDLPSYMHANLDLLKEDVRRRLFLPNRPISTKVQDSPPAKYLPGASVQNSLVSTGSIIEGHVENSIIFRGVKIAKGASVCNSVIMQKCVIEADAVLENVICDKYVVIKGGVRLSGSAGKPIAIGKKQEF